MKSTALLSSPKKLLGLEIIRFFSALAVLVWHYQHFSYVASIPVDFTRSRQPLYAMLEIFYTHGNYGVQVFWCISGYIFFFKYRNEISQKRINWRHFFVLRFSRLYPLHLITLMIVCGFQILYFDINKYYFVYQFNDMNHFLLQIFLASNWGFERGYSFNGPIWSISIEALVYFLFFLVLRNFGASPRLNVLAIALCLIARGFKLGNPVFECIAFFYVGGLAAIISQSPIVAINKARLNVLAFSILVLLPLMVSGLHVNEIKSFPLIFLFIYTPVLLFFAAENMPVPLVAEKYVEMAGNTTYASYLVHFPIQLLIVLMFSHTKLTIPFYSVSFFLFFIAITLVVSGLVFNYYEMPVQRYIRKRYVAFR